MAYVETRFGKKKESYVVRFYLEGKLRKVFLDASFSRRDAEFIRLAVEARVDAEAAGKILDPIPAAVLHAAPARVANRIRACFGELNDVDMPVPRLFDAFLQRQKGLVKDSSVLHARVAFKRFRVFFPENVRFDELDSAALVEFYKTLRAKYAPATVAKTVGDLRSFGKWAVQEGFVDNNPFLQLPKNYVVDRSRDFFISRDLIKPILDACPNQCWRVLFALWRLAGLRRQEPLALTPDSVDLKNRRLTVFASKTERYNGGLRVVPIEPDLARELERLLKELPKDAKFLIYEDRRRSYNAGFLKILKKAGLEPWPKLIQNLRVSRENEWVDQGYPAHVVAEWMGHSVRTQETYYLRVSKETFQRAAGLE